MQITEKLRKDILFAIPKLAVKQADKIASKCNVGRATVYRAYSKIKGGHPVDVEVAIAFAKLAASEKRKRLNTHNRLQSIEKQLSEIK